MTHFTVFSTPAFVDDIQNTDLEKELDQMGRFLSMVVDYKHKIGFPGMILVEPKPQELFTCSSLQQLKTR